MSKKILTILLLTCFMSGISFAQDSKTVQNWFDYTQNNKINGNWTYFGDYAFRFQIENQDSKWWQFHARPSIIFKTRGWFDIRGGIMIRYTFNSSGNNLEIRPWQGTKISWPNFGRFRFYHLVRLEERFSWGGQSNKSNFVFKGRYKLGLKIPINNPIITTKTFYALVGYEFFLDLSGENKEFIDDLTRFDVGIGYRFSDKTDIRLIYILQKSHVNLEDNNNSNDNIIRISVIQYFGFE